MTEKDLAATLREEAELFDAEDEEAVAEAVWVRPAPPRDPSQVYSVRIPVTELEKLRRVADHKGVTPSALMRTWVLLRLDAEYEAMLGVCPRCGQPAPADPKDDGPVEFVERLADRKAAEARKASSARKTAARKTAGTMKVPARAAAGRKTTGQTTAKPSKKAGGGSA